jgi:hypothetical protein
MAAMSFDDKAKTPDGKALAKGLGPSKALWDELVAHIAAAYPPIKDRTIVYLLPGEGGFRCAFVFGGKATDAARRAKLPNAVLKAIEEAPVYAEGRGFRLEVRTAKDVATMKTLAAIKMAH